MEMDRADPVSTIFVYHVLLVERILETFVHPCFIHVNTSFLKVNTYCISLHPIISWDVIRKINAIRMRRKREMSHIYLRFLVRFVYAAIICSHVNRQPCICQREKERLTYRCVLCNIIFSRDWSVYDTSIYS